MKKKILSIQKELNKEGVIPRMAYRRNSIIYPLICQVNNITGCYLSSNYKALPTLLERANLFIVDNPKEEYKKYYDLVSQYFSLISDSINYQDTHP